MRMKKPRYGLWAAILVLIVALTALLGTAIGKYIETQSFTGTLKITAELGSIKLQEHKAVRQSDGSYVLEMDDDSVITAGITSPGNTYELIPGLDIPKDPHIIITNKTPIEAYLFVEVVDKTANPAISFNVDPSKWLSLGNIGKNNGIVYVFAKDGTPVVLTSDFPSDPINILADNQIVVSQSLNENVTSDFLSFYACMGETALSQETDPIEKAKAVYAAIPQN